MPTTMRTVQRDLLDLASRRAVDVGPLERTLSVLLGARCAISVLGRGGLGRLVALGSGGYLLFRGITGRCALYRGLGLVHDERYPFKPFRRPIRIGASLEIARPPAEVYHFWRDVQRLAEAASHEGVRCVEVIAPDTSRWVAEVGGHEIDWTARIVEDVEGRSIAWESESGAFRHRGSVEFLPALRGEGTLVVLDVTWFASVKAVAAALRPGVVAPVDRARKTLRNVKELLEAGEVAVNGLNVERPARKSRGRAGAKPERDPVEVSSRESFPASDPPSWTPITSLGSSQPTERTQPEGT